METPDPVLILPGFYNSGPDPGKASGNLDMPAFGESSSTIGRRHSALTGFSN